MPSPDPSAAVSVARLVATAAHSGQTDKAGEAYIAHPARVADQFTPGTAARAVAWLHDVVEDTGVTFTDLSPVFPQRIIEALDAITHRRNEPRDLYYQRVRADRVALEVKIADVLDNIDPDRLALLDEATRDRLEVKYLRALHALRQ